MRVIVGLYISGDAASNQKEVDAVRPLVEEFGDLMDCILVGNEVSFQLLFFFDRFDTGTVL